MMKLKSLIESYRAASKACTIAEEAYANDPENGILESAFDTTYTLEHKAFEALSDELIALIGGDKRTARLMIMKNLDGIEEVISKEL